MTVWRAALVRLAAVIAGLLVIFHRDVIDMVVIWWNISTYTHCLFILPLVGWLIWQRRAEIAPLIPANYAPGLALIALGALVWMLGEAAGISLFRHAGLVFMIQASILTLLGKDVTRGLLFPIFYLSFLVPFGEELIPSLQTVTAKLSMIFLGWAGIPAHIEGVFITTPSGLFEVAEACSGIKFLVAMLAYGALVANVCFRSWWRRVAFMAISIVVPIIANGIRAYGTIHISQVRGVAFAASVDHVIWGWFFFAFVLAAVMGIGWKFFDRKIDDPWLDGWMPTATKPKRIDWQAAAVVLIIALIPVLWQAASASMGRKPVPHSISLPEVAGWQRVPISQTYFWRPRFIGLDHALFGEYVNANGQRVDLAVALFGWQGKGREIVGYGQGAADPQSSWSWTNDTPPPQNGKAERIFAPGVAREVISFYRLGGLTTGSRNIVKVETLKEKLLGGDQAAVAVLISAEDSKAIPARTAIEAFLHDLGSVDGLADRAVATARGEAR
jgi:exosortase A